MTLPPDIHQFFDTYARAFNALDGEAVAVNLDITPVEAPEGVAWIDPTHRA